LDGIFTGSGNIRLFLGERNRYASEKVQERKPSDGLHGFVSVVVMMSLRGMSKLENKMRISMLPIAL
jgi:hypothetical protein